MEWVTRINVAYYRMGTATIERHTKAWYNAITHLYLLPEGTDPWKQLNSLAMACIYILTPNTLETRYQ